ncbi:hypothetical protein HA402_007060 [Bradysia odoriphaga]|nr:hypothetical protein HA402_007060 [Bradysia odoriphaga]
MNQMCVNNIYANNNCNGYECFASIDNYSNLCKKIAIGENVTSNEFAMIFPDSVGESKWRLVFYPRGQYVGEKPGDSIGIYLIMVSCELESKTLKANVEFQLKSETADASAPVKRVDTIFNFSIPSKRWIGEPDFVRKKWLNSKRRAQFCSNDCLVIRCLVEETVLESSAVKVQFPLEPQTTADVAAVNNGNQIRQQNGHSEDPLERRCTTADKTVDNKSKTNGIRLQNGHGFTDRENNNDADWTVVGGKKGNNNQFVNNRNTRSNTVLSEPKSSTRSKGNEKRNLRKEEKERNKRSKFGRIVDFLTSCCV